MTICLIGFGSSHGDDRLAWEVLQGVELSLGTDANVHYIYSDRTVFDWLVQLQDMEQVVFIDAILSGARPGTVHRIEIGSAFTGTYNGLSSHGFSIKDAIELARRLDCLPPDSVLYGIEVGQCEPMMPMQAAVQEAVPRCVNMLIQSLTL